MRNATTHQLKIAVFTTLPVEYQAVRAYLTNIQEELHPSGTIYERGSFSSYSIIANIALVEIGPGNASAALEAERAISFLQPDLILFVGTAYGLKDVALGDVVAATKVYGYESGKAGDTFQPRPEIGKSTYSLIQRARAEARKSDWLQHLKVSTLASTPRVFVGPIAAGEKIITSSRSTVWQFLQRYYGEALAVEMEGYGFLQASHANQQIDALIIRGISHLVQASSEPETNTTQLVAAKHASAFAFEILAKLLTANVYRKSSPTTTILSPQAKTKNASPISLRDQYDYDVVLSYAGEDRHYVQTIADILQDRGVKVFYDQYEKSNLWGQNLYSYLSDLYQNRASYCVMFLSQYYARKLWTTHEREAAQARAFLDQQVYILPIRLDDTELPGMLPTIAYLYWYQETPDTIVNAILKKLKRI